MKWEESGRTPDDVIADAAWSLSACLECEDESDGVVTAARLLRLLARSADALERIADALERRETIDGRD